MRIFKTYFKLVKEDATSIIIFIAIFLIFSVTFILNQRIKQDASQYSKTYKIAVFNKTEDKQTPFTEYLKDNFQIVNIKDNDEAIKDALLFKYIDYVVNIEEDGIHGTTMVTAIEGYTIKSQINEYLDMQSIYEKYGSEDKNFVAKTIKENSVAEFLDEEAAFDLDKRKDQSSYFNFTAYMLMGNIISVVCLTALSLKQKGVKERLKLSNTSSKSIEAQLMLGNLVILLSLMVLIFVLPSFILKDYTLFTSQNLLLMINTLFFGITMIALGLLISELVTNAIIIPGITTLISLGFSFISGVFVGQHLLPSIALNISKFFPVYWFIRGNSILSETAILTKPDLLQYASYLGIIVLMGTVFIVLANLINQKKRMSV